MRETIISTELTQGKKVGGKEPLSKVAVRLGLTRVLLKRYAIELVNSNPGLAEWYDAQAETMRPEMWRLVEARAAENNQEYRNKKFWTANRLAMELKKDYRAIQREAEKYRVEHPEWFVTLSPTRGVGTAEHYHIKLVKKIRDFFSKMKKLEEEAFKSSKSRFKTEPAMARTMQDMMQNSRLTLEQAYNHLMTESAKYPDRYSEKELRQAYEYLNSNNRSA
jgi:hypothetical protein